MNRQPDIVLTDTENISHHIHPAQDTTQDSVEPQTVVSALESEAREQSSRDVMMVITQFVQANFGGLSTAQSPILPQYTLHDEKDQSEDWLTASEEPDLANSKQGSILVNAHILPFLVLLGCFLTFVLPSQPMALDTILLTKGVTAYESLVQSLLPHQNAQFLDRGDDTIRDRILSDLPMQKRAETADLTTESNEALAKTDARNFEETSTNDDTIAMVQDAWTRSLIFTNLPMQ